MDLETLEKLDRNPYYKMSKEQKEELAKYKRKPMVEFGKPDTHSQEFNRHNVTVNKRERKKV